MIYICLIIFNFGFCYLLYIGDCMDINSVYRAYAESLTIVYRDHYEIAGLKPAHLGAGITACTKTIRAHMLCCLIREYSITHNYDMTPRLAHKIIYMSLNYSINNRVLGDYFSMDGRTTSDKSENFQNIDKILERHSDDLRHHCKLFYDKAALIRAEVKIKFLR